MQIENPVDLMNVKVTTHPVTGLDVAMVTAQYAHTGYGHFTRASNQRMIAAAKKALGGVPVYVAGRHLATFGQHHNLGGMAMFVYVKS